MYDKNFKRKEIKYVLSKNEKDIFLKEIYPYIEKDKYYESTIHNVYFDDSNNSRIIHSLEKPIFKEKIRVRSYNTPKEDDMIFFEIKNKYKKTVGKRRTSISLKDYYKYLETGDYDTTNQILKEIIYHINKYQLVPKKFIAYDRKSYKGKEDDTLRITIDENLRSRNNDLHLENGSKGDYFFEEPHYIVEIKTLGSIPIWLSNILTKNKIFSQSFSKYGNIYRKERSITC